MPKEYEYDLSPHQEFIGKMEWEGGLAALLDYGLKSRDVPSDIREDYEEAAEIYREFCKVRNRIYEKVGY